MANTYVDYTATAGQTDFNFSFPYLQDDHVVVEVEGVNQTLTTNYTIETSPVQKIVLSNPTTALAGGELVRIKRVSDPSTDLVDFVNGSILTETELDRAYRHNRYLSEEAYDGVNAGLRELEGSTNYNAGNKQLKNLADGTLATDAVNKGYVDTQIALTDTNLAGFFKSTHTGNGTDNVFTLSFTPQTTEAEAYIVSIDGLVQVPDTDYTIGATAITFNTIPANSAEICVVATAASSVAPVNEVQVTATGSTTARSLANRFADVVNVLDYGVVGDGTTDDTTNFIACLNALNDGDTLNLNGKTINLYSTVTGVDPANDPVGDYVDAIALSGVARLYNKNDITISNGKIIVGTPSVNPAGNHYRFPSTFTVDGCKNIVFKDVTFHGKGQWWGYTIQPAGITLTKEERRAFAAQNGGHPLLVVRSRNVQCYSCEFRYCGSVAAFYSMSSHQVGLVNCFTNPASLGFAGYAFDSWAGNSSFSGFPEHNATLTDCSSAFESDQLTNLKRTVNAGSFVVGVSYEILTVGTTDFTLIGAADNNIGTEFTATGAGSGTGTAETFTTYSSKGCVSTEDRDVHVEVNGGYFADAWANGTDRDIGYAFSAAGGSTLVANNALVDKCATVGYTQVLTGITTTMLVSNIRGAGLGKTVHTCKEETQAGTTVLKYSNSTFNVVGGRVWTTGTVDAGNIQIGVSYTIASAGTTDFTLIGAADNNPGTVFTATGVGSGTGTVARTSRAHTTYLALPNTQGIIKGTFSACDFTGSRYCFVNDGIIYGKLQFDVCNIVTNGFLYNSANIGGNVGDKQTRGIIFNDCAIEDVSSETGAYTELRRGALSYVHVDLSTSSITLNGVRDIETSIIPTPSTYIAKYAFPRDEANIETLSSNKTLKPDSEKLQIIDNALTQTVYIFLPRPDKYKFMEFKIVNANSTYNLIVKDYTGLSGTTYLTLAPGDACLAWNDGANDYVRAL